MEWLLLAAELAPELDEVIETMDPAKVEGFWLPMVGTVVAMVIAWLGKNANALVKKMLVTMESNEANREALEALLEGMAVAQDQIGRAAKQAASDGKLSQSEIDAMRELALNHAKSVATGPAKDVVMAWTQERAASLIKQLLAKYKGKQKQKG
jgi:CO/xanthine dehydrogenase Mo-binding subunit